MITGKKLLAIAGSVIITGSLFAGCKPKATPQGTTSGPVTITYSHHKDPTQATTQIIDAFQKKYPNIKIKNQELPNASDQVHNAFVTALSGGDTSLDVIQIDVVWPAEFASAGWVEDLSSRFTSDMRSQFIPGTIQGVTYNGKIYAVPRYTDTGVLYYRKDLIPTPPKTWEELTSMIQANLGKNGIKNGIVFQGNQYEGLVCNAMEFIGSYGGSVLQGNNVTINSPKAANGINTMVNYVKTGMAPAGVTTYKEEDERIVYQQGATLFMKNWPYAWPLLTAADSPIKDKVAIAPIPVGAGGTVGTPTLGGWDLAISKFSKNKDAAWQFLQFMASPEAQKINALVGGKLPVLPSMYTDKDILAKNPAWPSIYAGLKNGMPRPVSPYYPQMSDSMQINFNKALSGGETTADALKNIQNDLTKIIQSGGK